MFWLAWRRFLNIVYTALIVAVALAAWGASNLAEVAALAPPPVQPGLQWNPILLQQLTGHTRQHHAR
jgi:hypothetical protein